MAFSAEIPQEERRKKVKLIQGEKFCRVHGLIQIQHTEMDMGADGSFQQRGLPYAADLLAQFYGIAHTDG